MNSEKTAITRVATYDKKLLRPALGKCIDTFSPLFSIPGQNNSIAFISPVPILKVAKHPLVFSSESSSTVWLTFRTKSFPFPLVGPLIFSHGYTRPCPNKHTSGHVFAPFEPIWPLFRCRCWLHRINCCARFQYFGRWSCWLFGGLTFQYFFFYFCSLIFGLLCSFPESYMLLKNLTTELLHLRLTFSFWKAWGWRARSSGRPSSTLAF